MSGYVAPSTSPSTVSFPSSETASALVPPVMPKPMPHLPFRRISIPTVPSLVNRQSIVSVVSIDSTPEDCIATGMAGPISKSGGVARKKAGHNAHEDNARKSRRKELLKPISEARDTKRRQVVSEFFETERAYVHGLDLIYSHFLTPIVESLNTSAPLLTRGELNTVFSNFIDIWNLHHSFFSSLSALLAPVTPTAPDQPSSPSPPLPPLSPILLSHFPYLSLYTPFITSFPSSLTTLTNLLSQPAASSPFAAFIQAQQLHPRCMKLTLRDWLLTIVQRCPRYLLLLKDLIGCTAEDDLEYARLGDVYELVSKITLSLNTSLATHTATLTLLSLQRRTIGLPSSFHFVTPGRMLEKRGEMIMVESGGRGRGRGRRREFLLFSDCLVWLERIGPGAVELDDSVGAIGSTSAIGNGNSNAEGDTIKRPGIVRSRSKSDAELSRLRARRAVAHVSSKSPPRSPSRTNAAPAVPAKRHSAYPRVGSTSEETTERWEYKGLAWLVDVEVVVPMPLDGDSGEGDESDEVGQEQRRLDVLSPEGSFVLYAGSAHDRDEWSKSIRSTKSTLLISLNVTHPNSTLTSSASTNHLRRSLQALPFAPSDERLGTIREVYGHGHKKSAHRDGSAGRVERRAHVDHWVPAIWIPDAKTDACMRCGRSFGWRRRRHHCRLCGRCVCSSCSGRTFFIADPMAKGDKAVTKAARACDECYETVFPLLEPLSELDETPAEGEPTSEQQNTPSLSGLPLWRTITNPAPAASTAGALMAMTRKGLPATAAPSAPMDGEDDEALQGEPIPDVGEGRRRVRGRGRGTAARPRSYYEILEDFQSHDEGALTDLKMGTESPSETGTIVGGSVIDLASDTARETERRRAREGVKEDTARKLKRFSMPAVALQTTSVLARTVEVPAGSVGVGAGRVRRFSLIPGKGAASAASKAGADVSVSGKRELGRGVAAGKLSELLGRRTKPVPA